MQRTFLKSKIHRATVTQTDLHYEGSISVDEALLEAADILPYEKVQVVNLNNGARLETYAMPAKRNSGIIGMNGGMARWGCAGDIVLIITYAQMDVEEGSRVQPKVIFVDGQNRVVGHSK